VRSAATDEAVCPPRLCLALFECIARQWAQIPRFNGKHTFGLTRREQQLVEMIGGGLTNKEIANELNLSDQTVKNHIHRILKKLGVSDRLSAVEVCRWPVKIRAWSSNHSIPSACLAVSTLRIHRWSR
jgi:DNA-binding NarL/FixJ family response regulator